MSKRWGTGGFLSLLWLVGSLCPQNPAPQEKKSPSNLTMEEAVSQNLLGVQKMQRGRDFSGAKKHFQTAIRLFTQLHQKKLATLVLGNLARLYAVHGKPQEATRRLKSLLEDPDLPPASRREALLTLAEIQRRQGLPEEALRSLEKALPLLKKTHNKQRIRNATLGQILLLREAGKHGKALSALTHFLSQTGGIQGLALQEKALLIPILGIQLAGYQANNLRDAADHLARQGHPGLAASLYFSALNQHLKKRAFTKAQEVLALARLQTEESGSKELASILRLKEATLLLAQGRTKGLRMLLRPLLHQKPHSIHWATAKLLCAQADRREGKGTLAAQGFQELGSFFEKRQLFPKALRAYTQAGLGYFQAGDFPTAQGLSKKVSALLPHARRMARNPALSPHTNRLLDLLYKQWIQSLLGEQPTRDKKSKEQEAFALADQERQGTLIADACDPLPLHRGKTLLLSLLGSSKNKASLRRVTSLARDLRGPRPNYAFPPANPAQLLKHLSPKEGILSFFLDSSQPRVWLLDQDGLHAHKPKDLQLKKRIRLLLRLIAAFPEEGSQIPLDSLQQLLAQDLFGPLKERLKQLKSIAVLPDSALGPLPLGPLLESLLDQERMKGPNPPWSLPNLRVLPCASLLLLHQDKRGPGPAPQAWIVTHPDFGPMDALQRQIQKVFPKVRSFEGKLPVLHPSPLGLLYIGAHGRLLGAHQALDLGGEIFSQNRILEAAPRLVHLAACSSVRGRPSSFEMQEGFAKTFLSRGTQFVIGARWEVNETTIQIFDRAFYSALTHLGPKAAFGQAIREIRKNQRSSSVFFWGAFVLYSRK